MNTDDCFLLEVERKRLEMLVEDRLKKGQPLNDDIVLAQNKIVDDLVNRIIAADKEYE